MDKESMDSMEAPQPWMTQDGKATVQSVLSDANKAQEIRKRKEHFKIISDLIKYGTADISNDPKWMAFANKYKVSLEEYMSFFPEDCALAMESAKEKRELLTNDGINRKSLAWYHYLGSPPECISKLFSEIYPEAQDRKRAWYSFFNAFPAFKVTSRKL